MSDIADEDLYEELLSRNQFVRLPSSSIRGIHESVIDKEHYEAPGGLESVAYELLNPETQIHFSRHVSEIVREDDSSWRVRYRDHMSDEETTSEKFDKIVLTPPVPQVVDLLKHSDLKVPEVLTQVKYSSRFAVALYPENPNSFLRPKWSCAYTKGKRLVFARFHTRSILLHASVPFTMSHYDDESTDDVVSILSSDFKKYMGWSELPHFSRVKCHRWRYSQTSGIGGAEKGVLEIHPGLLVAGDGILGSNFDRCSKSARDTVELILDDKSSSHYRSSTAHKVSSKY
jgi:predicted NAD/FAD-dependent oxidoreductase